MVSAVCMAGVGLLAIFNIASLSEAMGSVYGPIYICLLYTSIGIYTVKEKMRPYMSGDTYRSENVIFADLHFPEKADNDDPLFVSAYYKVADVDEYDTCLLYTSQGIKEPSDLQIYLFLTALLTASTYLILL